MSFYKGKQRDKIWMLIYAITLEESGGHDDDLEKVSQFGWWVTPTSSSPLQLVKLGINQITNNRGS